MPSAPVAPVDLVAGSVHDDLAGLAFQGHSARFQFLHQSHPSRVRRFDLSLGIRQKSPVGQTFVWPAEKGMTLPKRFSLTAVPLRSGTAEAAEEDEIFSVDPGTTVLQSRNAFSPAWTKEGPIASGSAISANSAVKNSGSIDTTGRN